MKREAKILSNIKRHWRLYIFLAIPVLYIFVFEYVTMGGVIIAFKDFSFRKGIFGSDWVGFDNFLKFFQNYNFWRTIKNTLVISLYTLIVSFPLPIIFALLLNCVRAERFRKVTQTIATMPHFISVVVMVGIIFQLLGSRTGLYGTIMEAITGSYPEDILSSPTAFRHIYVWSGVWQSFGWSSIIYTASLAGVDPTYHEAAQIDGATRLQRVWYIDLPTIMPTIITLLIMKTGSIMSVGYQKILLMQNSLNLSTSEVISTYTYRVGLAGGNNTDMSYGTAIGLFNSVINFIILALVNKFAKTVGETSIW